MDMDFDQEDQEILKLMERYEVKNPPKELLDDFEFEVKRKITLKPEGVGLPAGASVLVLVLALGLIVMHYLQVRQLVVKKNVKPEAVMAVKPMDYPQPSPEIQVSPEAEEKKAEEKFNKLSRELFILEALDEDEGLEENPNLLTSDVNMIIQSGQPI